MKHRLALEPGFAPEFARETAEQRSAGHMPEPFGLESLPQQQDRGGPSSYQPCWSAMLALSTLMSVETAFEWAWWEQVSNSKATVAVPRTPWVVACKSVQRSPAALQLGS